MILQGVKLTIQPLGVGYANRPKKAKNGGYVVFSPIYACLALTVFMCFSLYLGFGCGGGGGGVLPRDWYTTCLCSFSPWPAQKSKFLKPIFMIL